MSYPTYQIDSNQKCDKLRVDYSNDNTEACYNADYCYYKTTIQGIHTGAGPFGESESDYISCWIFNLFKKKEVVR